jgi:hypothetical protein
MRAIKSVGPDLSVALTNDNKLVVMVEDDKYGEFLAEVTDIDNLVRKLRELELIQMERSTTPGMVTSAEADLSRRASQ